MSKKAIKAAIKQVETAGYLAGNAQFHDRKAAYADYRKEVYRLADALMILDIMGGYEAIELMDTVFKEAADKGYSAAKTVEDYQKQQ